MLTPEERLQLQLLQQKQGAMARPSGPMPQMSPNPMPGASPNMPGGMQQGMAPGMQAPPQGPSMYERAARDPSAQQAMAAQMMRQGNQRLSKPGPKATRFQAGGPFGEQVVGPSWADNLANVADKGLGAYQMYQSGKLGSEAAETAADVAEAKGEILQEEADADATALKRSIQMENDALALTAANRLKDRENEVGDAALEHQRALELQRLKDKGALARSTVGDDAEGGLTAGVEVTPDALINTITNPLLEDATGQNPGRYLGQIGWGEKGPEIQALQRNIETTRVDNLVTDLKRAKLAPVSDTDMAEINKKHAGLGTQPYGQVEIVANDHRKVWDKAFDEGIAKGTHTPEQKDKYMNALDNGVIQAAIQWGVPSMELIKNNVNPDLIRLYKLRMKEEGREWR